jgi:hypothetical protein
MVRVPIGCWHPGFSAWPLKEVEALMRSLDRPLTISEILLHAGCTGEYYYALYNPLRKLRKLGLVRRSDKMVQYERALMPRSRTRTGYAYAWHWVGES